MCIRDRFTPEELSMRKGWGHSSIAQGNDFLIQSDSKKMGISHHSPYRNDKDMTNLEKSFTNQNLFLAKEGQTIKF